MFINEGMEGAGNNVVYLFVKKILPKNELPLKSIPLRFLHKTHTDVHRPYTYTYPGMTEAASIEARSKKNVSIPNLNW
jgi:hypothetical protein